MGPLLKALVERLQVALVLPAGDLAETQALTAQTLTVEHPMVTQVIALTAETRVMTDHPAMETVGPPVVVMAEVMVAAMVVVMAVGTVAATAEVMAEVMVMVETSRPDDLVFKKLY